MAYVSQEDKARLAPGINRVLKKYNMKGSISVRHHSTLVVTVRSGAIDFTGNYTHGDRYSLSGVCYSIDQAHGVAKGSDHHTFTF